jgi:predicted dienelactone hydrolase
MFQFVRFSKAFACALALALPAHADDIRETPLEIAGLRTVTWESTAPSQGARPLIVFSHGLHGCATQSRFLMKALAGAGYFVIAPNHRDATCGGGQSSWGDKPPISFKEAAKWSDSTYRDRGDDIRRLVEAIAKDERFRSRVDATQLGLAGHSLGGYTVLALAGAWPSWKLDSVKAVLALSPYSAPFDAHETIAGLAAPVMYQGGTLDYGITPQLLKPGGTYEASPPPKYLVEFSNAGHFAWTDLRATFHEAIDKYAVAFMDRYVRGKATDLATIQPGVARLLHAEAK